MKKGFSFFSLPETCDVLQGAQIAAKANYDGIEPVLSDTGYFNMNSTDTDMLRFADAVHHLGLEIPSVGAWSLWANNLASDEKSTREAAAKIIKKQLEMAKLLGADTILVVPGYVGCDFDPAAKVVRYDRAYDHAQEELAKLSDYAKSLEVCIGIENVWNKFLLSPLEMTRFIDEIGSPFVGAYFDVGNIMYVGYPDQWIEILGKRIKKVHFCDYRTDQSGLGAFVDLFAGDVDYHKVMDSLKSIGYDDYCTVEVLPQYKKHPYICINSNKPALDVCSSSKNVSKRSPKRLAPWST